MDLRIGGIYGTGNYAVAYSMNAPSPGGNDGRCWSPLLSEALGGLNRRSVTIEGNNPRLGMKWYGERSERLVGGRILGWTLIEGHDQDHLIEENVTK